MGISSRGPFYDRDYIAHEGHHGDESDFNPIFEDKCGPGRINTFDSPPAYRMRLQHGRYWDVADPQRGYHNMDASRDLINRYMELFGQGMIIGQGAGYEPTRWDYQWPQNAKQRAAQGEARGLSMEPFLDMLLLPEAERPSNIRECIEFFYPLSGSIPPDTDISPFISTTVAAYYVPDADPAKAGNLPLQLGEVSMMYGWYLAWKMILCPVEYHDNIQGFLSEASQSPDYPFEAVAQNLILDPKTIKSVSTDSADDIATLANISTAVSFVTSLAHSAARSGVGLPDSLEDVKKIAAEHLGIRDSENFASEIIHKYGTAWIASTLSKYVEVPYTHLNDLASVVVNGVMSTDKWASLIGDAKQSGDLAKKRAASAVLQIAQGYVTERIKDVAPNVPLEDIVGMNSLLEQFMITGVPSDALDRQLEYIRGKAADQLTAAEKALLDTYNAKNEEIRLRTQRTLRDFTQFGNSRPNPEPITLAIIGIGLAGSLIQGGLDYAASTKQATAEGVRGYLTDNMYRLNRNLQGGEASFDLSKHIRKGYWAEGGWPKASLEPDCKLQQGGQVLDYWTHAWSRVRKVISAFKNDRTRRMQVLGPNSELKGQQYGIYSYRNYFKKGEGDRGYPAYGYSQNGNRPRKDTYHREDSHANSGYSRCQGLGVLAKHVDASMLLILENIHLFSPFTHAYGFCPTAQILTNGYMKIDGVAPRRFLGRSNLDYSTRSDGLPRASAAPGRIWPRGRIDLSNAYGPHGVECWARKAPLPSRRLLEGAYGQRCNLSFDVGLNPDVPVMDAQFCGLMAVLLSHPEALRTCYQMGLLEGTYKAVSKSRVASLARLAAPYISSRLPLSTMKVLNTFISPRQVTLSPKVMAALRDPALKAAVANMDISPNVAEAINSLTARPGVQAKIAATSTGRKVVNAVASVSIASALGYLAYRLYRVGK